jgi:transposase
MFTRDGTGLIAWMRRLRSVILSFQTTPEGLTALGERIFRDSSDPIIVVEPAGLSWLMVAAYLRSQHPECRLVKAKGQKVAALRRYLTGTAKSEVLMLSP